MKKILIVSFLFLSFNAFGEAIHDWNPWSSIKKNSYDLNIKSIIVKSSNIGSARIVKKIEGIENLDVSKPIFAEEIEEIKNRDNKNCFLWFDGTEFCVFK